MDKPVRNISLIGQTPIDMPYAGFSNVRSAWKNLLELLVVFAGSLLIALVLTWLTLLVIKL